MQPINATVKNSLTVQPWDAHRSERAIPLGSLRPCLRRQCRSGPISPSALAVALVPRLRPSGAPDRALVRLYRGLQSRPIRNPARNGFGRAPSQGRHRRTYPPAARSGATGCRTGRLDRGRSAAPSRPSGRTAPLDHVPSSRTLPGQGWSLAGGVLRLRTRPASQPISRPWPAELIG